MKGELDSMRNYTYKLFEIMNQAGFGKSQSKDSAQSAAQNATQGIAETDFDTAMKGLKSK